jgi:hypothetical protein
MTNTHVRQAYPSLLLMIAQPPTSQTLHLTFLMLLVLTPHLICEQLF